MAMDNGDSYFEIQKIIGTIRHTPGGPFTNMN